LICSAAACRLRPAHRATAGSLISVYKFYVGGAVVTAVLLIGLLLAYRFIQIDIIEASNNVRGLEAAVNELAGKRLLTWESEHGIDGLKFSRIMRRTE
jgi:hypothetical protein